MALPRGPQGSLQFVIVVFPDDTHLLFLFFINMCAGTFRFDTIRISHACESRIEKPITRIAVRYQEACQMITNSDPKGQNLYPIFRLLMNSCSCLPLNDPFMLKRRLLEAPDYDEM